MNYCNCPDCRTKNCPEAMDDVLRGENARLREALTELRRWVADGDCSDDAGIWPGYATTAYKDAVQKADDALSNLRNAKSQLSLF
jgi:hypothetical protein